MRLHKPGPAYWRTPACRFKGGYAMRTFDLSPLYRSTVGFDRLFSILDKTVGFEGGPTYPPYNIERTGENSYRVTIAVAGFSESELSIEAKENALTVQGIFLRLDGKLGLRESCDRDRNAIGFLAGPFDIVGRIGRTAATFEARRLVEHRKQPVKADGRAIKWGKIECTHGISSFEATCRGSADWPDRVCAAGWP